MAFRQEVENLLDRLASAYCAGDAGECAALFTEDAQLHSPFAPPAMGRDAIEALHESWTADGGDKAFTILDAGGSDALGWCLCHFSEGDVKGNGTSLIVLERGAKGDWLIRMCCLHGDTEDSAAQA